MITTTNDDNNNNNDGRRNNNNGFFSRFRLRGVRRHDPSTTTEKTSTATNHDETTTFGEITDDEESFSSSFDDIDQLLALPLHIDDVVSYSSSSSSSSSPTTTTTISTTVATSQPTILSQTYTTTSPTCTTITYDELPNDNSIYKCIHLLSNHDIDLNRVGLQRLIMLTTGRRLSGLYNSEEIVSYILIYGGPFGSVEERLRYIFATMICNSPHIENDYNNGSSANENNNNEYNNGSYNDDYFDDYEEEKDALFEWISECNPNNEVHRNKNKNNTGKDDDDDDDDRRDDDINICYSSEQRQQITSYRQHPEGKGDGILHNHALRVLANALGNVSSSMKHYPVVDDDDDEQEQQRRQQIPLDGTIWKNIIRCIVDNIENTETTIRNQNINGTGYSLKILRLLYEIQPQMILPLLRHTLFTSLVYLIEYGNVHKFPMIYKEASYLLATATATPVLKRT